MEFLKTILPILTLLIGLFLNEIFNFIRERKERLRVLNIAISDLLEIRDRLIAHRTISKIQYESAGVTFSSQLPIGRIINELVPAIEDNVERYEENLSLIAKNDPVLAYRLRSKYFYKPIMTKLWNLTAEGAQNKLGLIQLENFIVEEAIPKYDKLILELAKSHSHTIFVEIQERLESGAEGITPELDKLISVVHKEVQKPHSDSFLKLKLHPQFGSAQGLITMSDDFDEPLEDFEEYMK
jgi:hypothetical protein